MQMAFIDMVSYKMNAEVVLNVTFYKKKILGPIPQKTLLNQSATLPPPTVEISSTTDLSHRPTTAQADLNITTGTPAVITNTSSNVYINGFYNGGNIFFFRGGDYT